LKKGKESLLGKKLEGLHGDRKFDYSVPIKRCLQYLKLNR